MKVVFISNYINHHQKPFCDALYERLQDNFVFIQSEPMEEERVNMGWDTGLASLSYVKLMYENEEECKKLIMNCDVLLAGWTKQVDIIKARMRQKKITVRISERIYREGQWKMLSPRGLVSKYFEHFKFRKGPAYLFCCGAYVASDFKLIHSYPGKMYKFGYFPETKHYNIDQLLDKKNLSETIDILYAGRFMKLKHPEYMIRLAADLKKENERRAADYADPLPQFRIHMVGAGELEDTLKSMVSENGLEDVVTFYGFLQPKEVRTIMERCHIHIFPSNHLEGWGAVVNESMNSACAVVACSLAGAVPFLINQWKNGVSYDGEDYDAMKEAVLYLMTHKLDREEMARNAYETIVSKWNADYVADNLMNIMEGWLKGDKIFLEEGPLSKATPVKPSRMFLYMESEKYRKYLDGRK